MKRVLMMAALAFLLVGLWLAVSSADTTSLQLAQGKTCQAFNEACGTATGAGGGPTACCEPFVCHNGVCKKYQEVNQPCGTVASPPCRPGLTCQEGICK